MPNDWAALLRSLGFDVTMLSIATRRGTGLQDAAEQS